MSETYLTDEERAAIATGPLWPTVERIVRHHRAEELREAAKEFGVNERTDSGVLIQELLLAWATEIEADDD